jgi:flagellar basal-body rod protein FlgG
MIRSLYIAATGMEAQNTNIEVISNNLANVHTTGFKRSKADFQDLMYQQLRAPGMTSSSGTISPTGIQVGLGVRTAAVSKLFTQGDFVQTSNDLDVTIEGDGLFQVQMPDASVAYTRAGNFKTDNLGRITTSDGYPIAGSTDQILNVPPDTRKIQIAQDGTVSVLQGNGTTPNKIGQIMTARFINNAGLDAIGKNLFKQTVSSGLPIVSVPGINGYGALRQGSLEMSNVNVIEEMVSMIASQRAYEFNSKAIQASDEMLQIANNLRR